MKCGLMRCPQELTLTYMRDYLGSQLIVGQVGHTALLDGVAYHVLDVLAPTALRQPLLQQVLQSVGVPVETQSLLQSNPRIN